jgi:crotonobetainyl-CoA:carnitine CoA-transferase CaiB-like acyl-CoA transferase
MMPRPLSGVRVLDLTTVLAGPYCTYQLALMGAEVIKVEMPGVGDLTRKVGADVELNKLGLGSSFLAQNSGKKSVEINLRSPEGRGKARELAAESDVLVANFRPGVLERHRLGWHELHELNPRLVYCTISGFGQAGPMRDRQAYDQIIQGLSGIMSVTGTGEIGPLRAGFPVCDTASGLMAAFAISSALAGRATTGIGACLDVSMLEASVSAMAWTISNYTIGSAEPRATGNQNPTNAPSGTFSTADGTINLVVNSQQHYLVLCDVLKRPDLADDRRFADLDGRKTNRAALNREIEAELSARSSAEWEELFTRRGVPAARILTVPEMVELDQLRERGFFAEVRLPNRDDRPIRVSSNGVLVDGEPLHPTSDPPALGQHNEEILGDSATPGKTTAA